MPTTELGLKTVTFSFLIISMENTGETKYACGAKLCLMVTAALLKIPFFS